jgi:LPXTG-site transpeptidase (sortase) family protein
VTAEPQTAPPPPARRGAAPAAPTVRAVARVVLPRAPRVRATARVRTGPALRPAAPDRVRARATVSVPSSLLFDPATLHPGPPIVARARVVVRAPVAESAPRVATPESIDDSTSDGQFLTDLFNLGSVDPETSEAAPAAVPKRGFGRRSILPISVAAAAAFVAATGYLAVTDPPTDGDIGRWSAVGLVPAVAQPSAQQPVPWPVASGSAGSARTDPFGPPAPVLRGAPTRLRVAAIGVDTPLNTLHLGKDGALVPPKNFAEAGWYADGTAPGDQGPAVIAGHVDSKRGPAIFYKLREMEAGDRIEVVRGGKTVRFTVVSTAWYPKTKFPTEQVYGPTPDRQLRLITCGGVFDHRLRSYKDNLVVYAVAG